MTYDHVRRYSSGVPILTGIFSPLPLGTLFQGTRGRGRRSGRGRGIK